jgi:hypothetical protein
VLASLALGGGASACFGLPKNGSRTNCNRADLPRSRRCGFDHITFHPTHKIGHSNSSWDCSVGCDAGRRPNFGFGDSGVDLHTFWGHSIPPFRSCSPLEALQRRRETCWGFVDFRTGGVGCLVDSVPFCYQPRPRLKPGRTRRRWTSPIPVRVD